MTLALGEATKLKITFSIDVKWEEATSKFANKIAQYKTSMNKLACTGRLVLLGVDISTKRRYF